MPGNLQGVLSSVVQRASWAMRPSGARTLTVPPLVKNGMYLELAIVHRPFFEDTGWGEGWSVVVRDRRGERTSYEGFESYEDACAFAAATCQVIWPEFF